MLAWRLLLATGDPAHADVIERTAFNGVLPGLSLDGTGFFYVNPLQRRTERVAEDERSGTRKPWFACACCPPNVMRLLSSWQQYLATTDETGVQIHQFADRRDPTELAGRPVRISTATGYPWEGAVTVTILETPQEPWTLSLRIPAWCTSATLRSGRDDTNAIAAGARQVDQTRRGRPATSSPWNWICRSGPPSRTDRSTPCAAASPSSAVLSSTASRLPTSRTAWRSRTSSSTRRLRWLRSPGPDLSPTAIGSRRRGGSLRCGAATAIELAAVPYFTWANRTVEAMRVWIPRAPPTQALTRGGRGPAGRGQGRWRRGRLRG